MTQVVASQIGSGTIPYTRGILPADERGFLAEGEGVRTGTQVMIGNPEDMIAVDAFMASGVVVPSDAPVQIVGPNLHTLPRIRMVTIHNIGAVAVYIGADNSVDNTNGFVLSATAAESRIALPVLHNTEVWAIADTAGAGATDLRILMY